MKHNNNSEQGKHEAFKQNTVKLMNKIDFLRLHSQELSRASKQSPGKVLHKFSYQVSAKIYFTLQPNIYFIYPPQACTKETWCHQQGINAMAKQI